MKFLYTWGGNNSGQLGLSGEGENICFPKNVEILNEEKIGYISCGMQHMGAISSLNFNIINN